MDNCFRETPLNAQQNTAQGGRLWGNWNILAEMDGDIGTQNWSYRKRKLFVNVMPVCYVFCVSILRNWSDGWCWCTFSHLAKAIRREGGDTGEQPQPGWESTFLNPQLFVAPQSPLFTPYLILILWKYFHNTNLKYSSEGSTSQKNTSSYLKDDAEKGVYHISTSPIPPY